MSQLNKEEIKAVVWTLTAGDHDVVSRDDTGFIANCIRGRVPGFVDFYWLTEREAIAKARSFHIAEIDRLQQKVDLLDARIAEIEQAQIDSEAFNRR